MEVTVGDDTWLAAINAICNTFQVIFLAWIAARQQGVKYDLDRRRSQRRGDYES